MPGLSLHLRGAFQIFHAREFPCSDHDAGNHGGSAQQPFYHKTPFFSRGLLTLYKKYPALYRQDNDWDGFQWINANDADRSIFSFIRRDETKKKNLLFICNFTPIPRDDYRVGVPKRGNFTLLLDNEHGLYEKGDGPAVYKPYSVFNKKKHFVG